MLPRVFPTVFADAFHVVNTGPAGELFLYDATGRSVRAVRVNARSEQTIARGELPGGIYHLVFQDTRTGLSRCAGTLAAQ